MEGRNEKAKLIQNIYSLTPLQEGMLFHYLSAPDSQGYVLQDCFFVNSSLREDLVKDALELLSMRHDVFRTAIVYEKVKEPVQVVYKNRPIEFNIENYGSLNEGAFEKKIQECLEADLIRGFDLQKDTLVRFKFLKHSDSFMIILTMHHIIVDGWCANMVIGGFLSLYKLLSQNVSKDEIQKGIAAERETSSEFVDYVKWQQRQDKKKAQEYWENLLDGYDNVAKIEPLTKPDRSDEQMCKKTIAIGGEISKKISEIVREEKITYSVFAETICGILLQQYINEKDVVFGKIVSGRNADINGIENIMGLFVNTIPVRVITEKDITARKLMLSLHEQSIKSSSFDFCPLADIQKASKQGSDLINVLFAFENYASGLENSSQSADDQSAEMDVSMSHSREQTEYSITITSYFTNDTLMFSILYDPSQFAQGDIDRLTDRLEMINNEIVNNPDVLVDSLRMATNYEEQLIFTDFNATETDYPRDKTVVELFEEQVKKTPDNIALVLDDEKLTYAELNARANVIAHRLREMGVQPDDFIAVIADRSTEMIAGIYGIIKAGGAYVPIDPTYPEDRIAFMLEDCAPKAAVVYTSENLNVPENIAVIDLSDNGIWNGNSENPEHVNTPNDLIYCIYTSGTTGKPKGVIIEHHGVTAMQDYLVKLYEVTENDNVLQFANYIFDASVWEMTLALYCGATLVLISADRITDTAAFAEYVTKNNVTLTLLPPQYFRQTDINTFRVMTTGGSASDSDVVKHVKENCRYINAYGPTENTVLATHWEYKHGTEIPANIPIGKPISNSRIYILNGNVICGIGVPGELCIAGEALARGYLNRPELTAEKFVKNPFGEGRMYRSGDLARWLPDGNIEYLGRIDEQVKIRGFRIELGEIESRIREIEGIKDCAVIAKADASGDKAIYAYYTSEAEVSVSEIRDKLSENLPEYMVPAYMMQIDEIPVTRNGKLDKRALPQIEAKAAKEYVAPRNEVEEAICNAFSEILNVEKVGAEDSFFELGGDSIKAIRVVSKLGNAGFTTTVRDIMAEKKVKRIADKILNPQSSSSDAPDDEMLLLKYKDHYLQSKESILCRSLIIDLKEVDYNRFNSSVVALILGNSVFRAVFSENKKTELDYVFNNAYSVKQYTTAANLSEQCRIIELEVSKQIGSLIRIVLFTNKDSFKLLICGHPAVVDMRSLFTLFSELYYLSQKDNNTYISGISINSGNVNGTIPIMEPVNGPLRTTDYIADNTAKMTEYIENTNIGLLSSFYRLLPGADFVDIVSDSINEAAKSVFYNGFEEITVIRDILSEFERESTYPIGVFEKISKRKYHSSDNRTSTSVSGGYGAEKIKAAFNYIRVNGIINADNIVGITLKDVFLSEQYNIKINIIVYENGACLYVMYDRRIISESAASGFTRLLKMNLQNMISDAVSNYLEYSIDLANRCNGYTRFLSQYNEGFIDSEYSEEKVSAPLEFLRSQGRGDERNIFYPVEKKYGINKIIASLNRIICDQPAMRCCYDYTDNSLKVYKADNNVKIPVFSLLSDEQTNDLIDYMGEFICSEKIKEKRSVLSWIYVIDLSDKFLVVLNVSHSVWDGMCDDVFRQLLEEYLNGASIKPFIDIQLDDRAPEKRDYTYYINSITSFSSAVNVQVLSEGLSTYSVKVNLPQAKSEDIQNSPISWGASFIGTMLAQTGVMIRASELPLFVIHHNRNKLNSTKLGCVCDAVPVVYHNSREEFDGMFSSIVESKASNEILMDQVQAEIQNSISSLSYAASPIVLNYHGTHSNQSKRTPFRILVNEKEAEQQNFLFLDYDISDNMLSLEFNAAKGNCERIGQIITKLLNL